MTMLALPGLVGGLTQSMKTPNAPKPPTAQAPSTPKPRAPVSGYSSTLLTGAGGVAPGSQNVGANTLLGR